MNTNQPTEEMALLTTHWPAVRQVATHVSDWVLVRDYPRLLFKLKVGIMGASSTLDAKLQQASTSTGTGVKDISGKAITQLTQAGTDDNSVVGINLRTEELDVQGGFEYVRFSVTIAAADCTYDAELLGFDPRYAPVPVTIWDEIIS
jgi:hypothetical protein